MCSTDDVRLNRNAFRATRLVTLICARPSVPGEYRTHNHHLTIATVVAFSATTVALFC